MGEGGRSSKVEKESLAGKATLFDIESYLSQFPTQCVVLLLDEFDHLRSETFSHNFLTELRALASGLEFELACVTASYWDMFTLGNTFRLAADVPLLQYYLSNADLLICLR